MDINRDKHEVEELRWLVSSLVQFIEFNDQTQVLYMTTLTILQVNNQVHNAKQIQLLLIRFPLVRKD